MSDELDFRVRSDYSRARFKAFINSIRSAISGAPNRLLSYDDVKEKLHLGGPISRGVQTVRVEQIAGSLNRYHEFDRAFLPLEEQTADRWQNVDRAFYQDVSLPPVLLYKVGEVYFVIDGNHRVSIARQEGAPSIEARVIEVQTSVPLTPDIQPDDLIVKAEYADFLDQTQIMGLRPNVDLSLTVPGGYEKLLEQICRQQCVLERSGKGAALFREAVENRGKDEVAVLVTRDAPVATIDEDRCAVLLGLGNQTFNADGTGKHQLTGDIGAEQLQFGGEIGATEGDFVAAQARRRDGARRADRLADGVPRGRRRPRAPGRAVAAHTAPRAVFVRAA